MPVGPSAIARQGPTVAHYSNQATAMPLVGDRFEKLRQLVTTRWEQGYAHWQPKFEQFYRYEKLVNMVSKKKLYDWKANAFLPYPFAISEQSAALKWMSLFGTRPYVTVKARHPGLAQVADRREALLDWHMSPGGDLDLVRNTLDLFRMAERYGKAVALIIPHWETRTMRYRSIEEHPTALGPVARQVWKMKASRDYKLRLVPQDLTDLVPQPGFKRINGHNGVRWIERRYWKTKQELLEMQEAGQLGPAVGGQDINEIAYSHEQPSNEYKLRRMFLGSQTDIDHYRDRFDSPVEVIEYQGVVPRECLNPYVAQMEENLGLDPTQRIVTLLNRQVVGGDVANFWDHRMKTYVEMDCVPEIYDFYGKGKIEPIEHLTYVGNEIVNMRLDNVKMAVNGMIGVHGAKMPSGWKRRMVSQPWGVVETNGPPQEVIQRLALGDVTASSYQEQQQIFTLIQEADAVNETLMGAPGAKARTLGEHRMKAESASQRLQFELVGMADQLLGWPHGMAGFVIGYDRQYLPLNTYISVINPETPDDFLEIAIDHTVFQDEDQHFIYLPTGATEGMDRQAKRFDLANLLDVMGPFIPDLAARYGPAFVDELVKITFKTYGFDPSRFLRGGMGMMGMPQPGMPPGGMPGMPGMPGMLPAPISMAIPGQQGAPGGAPSAMPQRRAA